MSSLFDSLVIGGASSMLDQAFGEAVSITRGTTTTGGVRASWDAQTRDTATRDVTHTAMVDRVWYVTKTAYTIRGEAVEPRTGDRLNDSAGVSWEVLPAKAVPPVTTLDSATWKILTKRVV